MIIGEIMINTLRYELITNNNIHIAKKAKANIFPDKDFINAFTITFIPHITTKQYYLVYDKNILVGITGLYSYMEYVDDVWLGWFGVIANQRNKGYGKQILLDTINKANKLGYKYIRLYTDSEKDKNACKLYESLNFKREKYTIESPNCTLYSLQLRTLPYFELWNNKMLYLNELNKIVKSVDFPKRPNIFKKG